MSKLSFEQMARKLETLAKEPVSESKIRLALGLSSRKKFQEMLRKTALNRRYPVVLVQDDDGNYKVHAHATGTMKLAVAYLNKVQPQGNLGGAPKPTEQTAVYRRKQERIAAWKKRIAKLEGGGEWRTE